MFKSRADRNAWLALGLAVLVGALLIQQRIGSSPPGRVIVQDPLAPWIMAVEPFSANIRQWGRANAPVTRFATAFRIEDTEGGAMRIRAFGDMVVRLNGTLVQVNSDEDRDWQQFQRVDLEGLLKQGRNQVDVQVRNRRGPGLLSLQLVAGSQFIDTGSRWQASVAGRPLEPARIANDIQRHPEAGELPSPAEALRHHAPALLALTLLFAGVFVVLARRGVRVGLPVVIGLIGIGWGTLFLLKFVHIPLSQGYDGARHLEYLAFLDSEGRLPLAIEGWSLYHPPLYYLVVGLLRDLGGVLGEGAQTFMTRLPSFAAGLAIVWLSGRMVALLYPERPHMRLVAMVFAAALPMNLMLAGYVSNEGLMAALSCAALLAGVGLMLSEAPERELGDLAVLSVWLGLALLTKFSALVPALVIGVFVYARLAARTQEDSRRRVLSAAALVAPALLLAGWFYLRNVLYFGRPLVGNWDLPVADQIWWSQPGFHTLDYYTEFGRVLTEPWFASLASFWDSLYSTAWGDGMLGGKTTVAARNPAWHYGWMALGYWTALPISALVVAGLGLSVRDTLRHESTLRRAALGLPLVLLVALGFAMGLATMQLPYFGQAKAFYGLCLVPVLAMGFARATVSLDDVLAKRWGTAARAPLFAVLGACLAVLFLGFVG